MSVTEAEPGSSPAEPDQQSVETDRLYYFHRYQLQTFFKKYNPSKLDDVDALLEAYDGEEETLFRALEKKYSVDTPCEEFSLTYAAYKALILEATAEDPVGDFDDAQYVANSGVDHHVIPEEVADAERLEEMISATGVIPTPEPSCTETFAVQPPDSSTGPVASDAQGAPPIQTKSADTPLIADQPPESLKESEPSDSRPEEEEAVPLSSSNNEVNAKSSVKRSPSEGTEQSPSPSRRQPHLTVSVHRSQEPVHSRVSYVVELKCDGSLPEVSLGSARTAAPAIPPPPVAHPTTVKHSTYTCATKKLATASATKGAKGYSSGPGVSATLQQMWRLTQL